MRKPGMLRVGQVWAQSKNLDRVNLNISQHTLNNENVLMMMMMGSKMTMMMMMGSRMTMLMMMRRWWWTIWKEWQILGLGGNLWPAEAFAFLQPVSSHPISPFSSFSSWWWWGGLLWWSWPGDCGKDFCLSANVRKTGSSIYYYYAATPPHPTG